MNRQLRFTVTDLSVILGKAPVTLRGWERKGHIVFPRNSKGDRSFHVEDIRQLLKNSWVQERIEPERVKLIEANLTLMELLECE